jgi:hypothetical protein
MASLSIEQSAILLLLKYFINASGNLHVECGSHEANRNVAIEADSNADSHHVAGHPLQQIG